MVHQCRRIDRRGPPFWQFLKNSAFDTLRQRSLGYIVETPTQIIVGSLSKVSPIGAGTPRARSSVSSRSISPRMDVRHDQLNFFTVSSVTYSSTFSNFGGITNSSFRYSESGGSDSATRRVTTNRDSRLFRQVISTRPGSGTRQVEAAAVAVAKEEPPLGMRIAHP